MRESYRDWLISRKYDDRTIQTKLSQTRRVEKHYGDIDQLYDEDRLESLIAELHYSADDARRSKKNPSKMLIEGDVRNNLASYKASVALYQLFRSEVTEDEPFDVPGDVERLGRPTAERESGQLIGLERDMQAVLRQSIEQLEEGLVITDDGAERSVSSGFIDISAKDSMGVAVVIELKTGTARQNAVGQILSYMGDVAEEDSMPTVRGILVAGDFDKKARAAARMVPNLSLRKYAIQFEFSEGGN